MLLDNIYHEQEIPSPLLYAWRTLCSDGLAMTGFYGVITLTLLSVFGGLLAPYALDQQFLDYQLLPPAWSHYGNVSFFLGTDDLGRDILSRLLIGTSSTYGAALFVTIAAILCGTVLGVFAGATHGLRSAILKHVLDTLLSIPSLLLAIVVVAFVGPSLQHAMFAVWLAILPRIVHTVYSTVSDELKKEYVVAARLDGASIFDILTDTILSNIMAVLITEFTRAFSMAILDIAALGFLALGAQLPSPEWGAMLSMSDSLELIYVAPWAVMLPGGAILMSVLLVNLLGNGLQRAIARGVE